MTAKEKYSYWLATERRMKSFEREYLPGMVKILRQAYKNAATALRKGSIEQHLSKMDVVPGIGAYIMEMYTVVGSFYARKTLREINASAVEKKADDQWIADIIEYFQTYLLNKAVLPIRQTTIDDVRKILEKGVREGWGIDKMAFELDHTELSVSRARTIVRTELGKAQFEGKKLGDSAAEWETWKFWISADDFRVRDTHRVMSDKRVDSGEKFAVPRKKGGFDMMEGPCDPEGSAENVINCRCTHTYRAKRDANGRLIRKRKISVILPQEVSRRRPSTVVTV